MLAQKLAPFSGVTTPEADCNAHGRRKPRDAEAVLAREGGAFVSTIYLTEAEAHLVVSFASEPVVKLASTMNLE